MVQRIVLITAIQLVLYAVGIPMLVAYHAACDRLGPSCGAATSTASSPRRMGGFTTAQMPR